MKTNFPQRSRSHGIRVRWYVVAFGMVIIAGLGSQFLGGSSSVIVSPLYSLRTWYQNSESVVPLYFRTRSALNNELQGLRDELGKAQVSEDRVHALEEENSLLRSVPQKEGEKRIVADVLMRPNDTPYDTFVVHKGSADGVADGALVYTNTSVIGVVARTFRNSALVSLFSSPGIKSPVYIYGPNIFAEGEGIGGGVMRMAIPQGVALKEGEPVVVPLEGSGVYGHIEHIQLDVSQPDQYAYVAMYPSINTLRFVSIDTFPMPGLSYKDAETAIKNLSESPLLSPFNSLLHELPLASSTATSTHP